MNGMRWSCVSQQPWCVSILVVASLVAFVIVIRTLNLTEDKVFCRTFGLPPLSRETDIMMETKLVRTDRLPKVRTDRIPKRLVQTYHKPESIPNKVFDNIQRYASDYERVLYTDADILKFLDEHFHPTVRDTFHQLQGAHKADLFRYCYLYVHGGVYADIKTEFIEPLSDTFSIPGINMYTVLAIGRGTIYQGVIASTPRDPIFLEAISYMIECPKPVRQYLVFTADLYRKLAARYGVLVAGRTLLDKRGSGLYLFKEECEPTGGKCYDGLDRYKGCCFIQDKGRDVIKTRYADFPW